MLSLLQKLLEIDTREVEFPLRGFTCTSPEIRHRLENIGRIFLQGYHTALQYRNQSALAECLSRIEPEHCGFAYEGAAMALALQGQIFLRRNSLHRFMEGVGKQHIFMLHVGAGWAYARLPWLRRRVEAVIKQFHPVLRWLIVDGYGFHEGYFHWKDRTGLEVRAPRVFSARLSEDARHVFFQGLGRSLWFIKGASVHEISPVIARFHPIYQGDAWSGVGLACAYAGGLAENAIAQLRAEAEIHSAALAQGTAFAAKARQLAGNPAKHTQIACDILCGMSTERAAALCDETFNKINLHHSCPYQHWRKLLQEALFSSARNFKRGNSHETNSPSSLVAAQPY
ncbi:MAG TPA: DUF1702 family protein [Candidatus Angelobacter sp.]|nr:DUF1702 family protein [Candidatus Angelobacter sp.]